ncbi:MAG: hypothetical protein H0V64_13150 [Geodermatophilaceae bacterium]|nr:hypothetical protein [Geodermatophilaceae bacterium]MDQ3377845.1 hypothetical protein [Actinomycetota bacterium]
MSDTSGQGERIRPGDESGIIVFGGGGGGRGCAGRGCLFWILVSVVLSVTLTVLANLVLLLFSGGGSGVGV